jgi:hypothetical protein
VEEKGPGSDEPGVGEAGWYFTTAAEGEEGATWVGPHATEEEALNKGRNSTSFKRLLLNKCQEQFNLVSGAATGGASPCGRVLLLKEEEACLPLTFLL